MAVGFWYNGYSESDMEYQKMVKLMKTLALHTFLSVCLVLSSCSMGSEPAPRNGAYRMSKPVDKVNAVKFGAYHWDLSRNLAREVLSQGDRLTVYYDLLATAMRGDTPMILQPVQAARPDASKQVNFIVAGVGRLTSIRRWESSTPQERLRDAMLKYRSDKGVEFIPEDQQKRIALGLLAGVSFAEFDGEGMPPVDSVIKAFQSDVFVPVVWSDLTQDQAESVAVRDLVVRQGATTADKLMIYSREIVKDFSSKGKIAAMLNVSPPQVSKYSRWHDACIDKAISYQVMQTVKLHNGSNKVSKPCQFDKVLTLFKIGLRSARLKDDKGRGVCQYSKDEQDSILSAALLSSWNTLKREGVSPAMDVATDSDLLLIQYPDVVSAVQAEESRIVKLAQDKEADEAKAKAKEEGTPADATEGETAGDTPMPAATPAAAPVVKKPTLSDVVNFFDKARWDNTIAGPIVAPMRRFVNGELSAQATADTLAEVRHNRQKKAKVVGLPEKVGDTINAS